MSAEPDFKSLPAATEPGATPFHLAAVDLGSNTFHLLVARLDQGEPRVVERLKFRVGLAGGLRDDGSLSPAVFARALDALRRIADRIGGIPRAHLRAVGTSTLRALANPGRFLSAAESILGVPVRVVSGEEEARLIFFGAADTLPESSAHRLVIDIGGGSTELALGLGHAPTRCLSLEVGCVAVSRLCLAAASPQAGMAAALERARAACAKSGLEALGDLSTVEVIGTSGSIESIRDVLRARGRADGGYSLDSLREVFELLAAAPSLPLAMPGLEAEREEVFPGGVVILMALWEQLGFTRLGWADGALEDGLLRELVPMPAEGLRGRTVAALQARFSVDPEHAQQVRAVAANLHELLAGPLGLTPADGVLLAAAASVHDVGLAVAAPHHERHGAWLLRNSELRGFTAAEQLVLIALVRGHRGAWPQTAISALDEPLRAPCARLCVLLRLAVILKRPDQNMPPEVVARDGRIEIRPDAAWRAAHPFLLEALIRESERLERAAYAPRVVVTD